VTPTASDAAIVTDSLSKRYGDIKAVDGLTVEIPSGVICGFVGPNGSGKTTTIRMLLGLVRPTAGKGSVLGHPLGRPRDYLQRVGALIEGPAFYPTLSGEANLRILAKLGGFSTKRVPELIDQVGLTGRGKDRASNYSLGMKQRLGVAAALLPDPDLLILDEPTNGLDPPGIIEMRDLMRSIRDSGKTIFVSSHLLSELERVADWLVVLQNGKSLYAGPKDEMGGARKGAFSIRPERIAAKHGDCTVHDGTILVVAPPEVAATINRECAQAGITLVELHHEQATLEESFLSMIGGQA
jgi:ABC-2 type transport system ATP-binding protein